MSTEGCEKEKLRVVRLHAARKLRASFVLSTSSQLLIRRHYQSLYSSPLLYQFHISHLPHCTLPLSINQFGVLSTEQYIFLSGLTSMTNLVTWSETTPPGQSVRIGLGSALNFLSRILGKSTIKRFNEGPVNYGDICKNKIAKQVLVFYLQTRSVSPYLGTVC